MAVIDESQLAARMLKSAREVLGDIRPASIEYATIYLRRIAEAISFIVAECTDGRMLHDEAYLHLNIQKNLARCSLYGLGDVGVLAADAAIDAALATVREGVNVALGFDLL